MTEMNCVVHKFGGTSLADAACFRRVAQIIAARPEQRRAVVVSAMSGVTNALVRAVELAGAGDTGYRDALAALHQQHEAAIGALLSREVAARLNTRIERDLADIGDVLHATTLLHRHSRDTSSWFATAIWSAQILAAYLAPTINRPPG